MALHGRRAGLAAGHYRASQLLGVVKLRFLSKTMYWVSDEKSQIWGLPEKVGFIFHFITFLALAPWATKRDCLFFKMIQYNRLL